VERPRTSIAVITTTPSAAAALFAAHHVGAVGVDDDVRGAEAKRQEREPGNRDGSAAATERHGATA
jgi:hypothetical protein